MTTQISSRSAYSQRSFFILYVGAFVSSLGVFLVAPYLARYLTTIDGFSASLVGVFLGLSYVCLRAGGLAAAAIAARIGGVRTLLVGNVLRIVGYLLLLQGSVPLLGLALALIGLGGGLFFPVSRMLLLTYADEAIQIKVASVRNMTANLGVALGPVVGLLLLELGEASLFVTAAAAFTAVGLLTLLLPEPPHRDSGDEVRRTFVLPPWRDSRTWLVALMAAGLGATLIQLESSIPLAAARLDLTRLVAAVFVVNAVIVVVFQPAAVKIIERLPSGVVCLVAFLLLAGGLSFFAVVTGAVVAWLLGTVILSLGEVLISLKTDDVVRRMPSSAMTAVYGFSGVTDGLGGLAGSISGTTLLAQFAVGASRGLTPTYVALSSLIAAMGFGSVVLSHRSTSTNRQKG